MPFTVTPVSYPWALVRVPSTLTSDREIVSPFLGVVMVKVIGLDGGRVLKVRSSDEEAKPYSFLDVTPKW
jgi:hypothetical protein